MHDNAIVHEAARRVAAGQVAEVLPLFCFDPRFLSASAWGNSKVAGSAPGQAARCMLEPVLSPARPPQACAQPALSLHVPPAAPPHAPSSLCTLQTGAFRAQFLLESVLDLKQRLRAAGSDLMICMGRPEEVRGTCCTEAVRCFGARGQAWGVACALVAGAASPADEAAHSASLGTPSRCERRAPQVLPGLMAERGSGRPSVVLAQREVTSEETRVERKVGLRPALRHAVRRCIAPLPGLCMAHQPA